MGQGVGTYFEASVVIVALVFVGRVLELRARERTGDAVTGATINKNSSLVIEAGKVALIPCWRKS